MKRYIAPIAALLALVLMLTGCSENLTPGGTASLEVSTLTPDTVVAEIGDRKITRAELISAYDSMISMYTYYGMEAPTEESEIAENRDAALNSLVSAQIMLYQADLMGLSELSQEDEAAAQNEYAAELEDLYETFYTYAEDEGAEDPEARTLEMINEALTENGWDMNYDEYKVWLLSEIRNEKVLLKLEEKIKGEVTLSDGDTLAQYDALVAQEAETYAQYPEDYLTNCENYEMFGGTPCAIVPEGYLRVKVIGMAPETEIDGETLEKESQMAALEGEYGKLVLKGEDPARQKQIAGEYQALSAAVAAAKEAFMADTRTRAEEAIKKLENGASFDDILVEYGDDTAYLTYETIGEKGRLLYTKGDDGWAQAIHDAVATLQPGEYSSILEDENTLFIVQLVGEETPGTKTFEELEASLRGAALEAAQEEAWLTQQDAWAADTSMVTYYPEHYQDVGLPVG